MLRAAPPAVIYLHYCFYQRTFFCSFGAKGERCYGATWQHVSCFPSLQQLILYCVDILSIVYAAERLLSLAGGGERERHGRKGTAWARRARAQAVAEECFFFYSRVPSELGGACFAELCFVVFVCCFGSRGYQIVHMYTAVSIYPYACQLRNFYNNAPSSRMGSIRIVFRVAGT